MKISSAILVSSALVLSSCDDSDSSGGAPDGVPTSATGVAVKGPVADATVTVLALRPTGVVGATLGSGTSGADGAFDVPVGGFLGWALVRVTGGTFTDEATGASATIPGDEPLLGFADVQEKASVFAVTPLTTLAAALVPLLAHDPDALLDDSVQNAFAATADLFGLADVATVVPADLTAGPVVAGAEADAGAVVAGMARLAETAGVATTAMVRALARDASDARIDGLAFGTPVPLGAGTLSPTAGTTELGVAIADFLASARNTSGLTAGDTLVDDELALSTGVFDRPIQVRGLLNGFGTTTFAVEARLRAKSLPASPQVLIDAQPLTITSQTVDELGFMIPGGLAPGLHDLVVEDQDTGLRTRVRDAIEVVNMNDTPTITRVAPPAGPLTGGTLLRVEGANFLPTTLVRIDGIPATTVAADFPRSLVVRAPPHATVGAVDVSVQNGAIEVTVVDAFEYRAKDVRVNPALPAPTDPIVFGAFRLFADAVAGVTAQTLSGRASFTSVDQGTFSLDDLRTSAVAPAIVEQGRSGDAFQSNESLGKAFLLSDPVNSTSDFVRGFTNETNGVSLGATAFGPACFFPEPEEARVETLARAFWLNGIEVNLALGTVRQKTGWLELDEELLGSANLLVHGRALDGTTAEVGAERWELEWTLEENGTFHGLRAIEGTEESLTGRFSQAGDLGLLTLNGSDGTLGYYLLTPIQHGIESGAFGGWAGGFVQHEIAGAESAFESGLARLLVGGDELDRTQATFARATRMTESLPASVFAEQVSAAELDVTPSGRVFRGDDLVGYVNPLGELRLDLGEFPDEDELGPSTARVLGLGAAVFRDSRKSLHSLETTRTQVAIEAKLQEVGTTHAQEIGTDLFGLTLEPGAAPEIGGVAVPLAGTIPVLAAASITGTHKSTARDGSGAVTTKRGQPPAWGVEVGYAFVDDELELFATQATQPTGRFTGATFPRWLASGALGNDGEVASLRGNDEFLGDTLMFLVADRGAQVPAPVLDMDALQLDYAPGATSSVTSSRSVLVFGAGTVAVTTESQTLSETGTFSNASVSDSGPFSAATGQSQRMVVPTGVAPDREWQTFWSPSGDAFFGIDDTPGVDVAGLVLGTERNFFGGSFVDDDRILIGIELDPSASRATTLQLQLKPRVGSILTGERVTSLRDAAFALAGAQSFVGVDADDLVSGEARVAFIGQLPVLRFLFNARDDAIGQEELGVLVTPRIVHAHDL